MDAKRLEMIVDHMGGTDGTFHWRAFEKKWGRVTATDPVRWNEPRLALAKFAALAPLLDRLAASFELDSHADTRDGVDAVRAVVNAWRATP